MDNLYIYSRVEYAEDDTRESPGRISGVLVKYGAMASDGRNHVYQQDSLTCRMAWNHS